MRLAGASALASVLAVLGPGLLAGLSDDDPAGITTYSILGTEHGYRLLWIIPASTVLLVQFHLVAVRIGAATGKGFVAIVRERWGRSWGYAAVLGLLFALNVVGIDLTALSVLGGAIDHLQGIGPESSAESFGHSIIRNQIFGGRPEDKDVAIAGPVKVE